MAADVTFLHPEYKAHRHQVKLVNDIYHGIDTAKELIFQSPNEYNTDYLARKEKATLDNFIERIVTAMSGQIFRKPLMFNEFSDAAIEEMEIIYQGKSLDEFGKDMAAMGIRDGKSFCLVDVLTDGGAPYFALYEREQLTNWRIEDGIYTMVVLLETYQEEDGFETGIYLQYRVIDEQGNVQIWRQFDSKGDWSIAEEIITSYNFLPFYALNVDEVPPLYDIAKINANHLNFSSKKDSYLETAGSPIPFGKGLGIDANAQVIGEGDVPAPALVLGVNSVVLTDNPEASFEWVEMSGNNIEALQKDLNLKAESMGQRALTLSSESTQVKTATQIQQENSESTSRLTDIASDLQQVLNIAYNSYCEMKSTTAVGEIILNKDYNNSLPDANIINGLNAAQIAGNLSRETFIESMVRAEYIEIESVDDELARIEDEMIPLEETDAKESTSES